MYEVGNLFGLNFFYFSAQCTASIYFRVAFKIYFFNNTLREKWLRRFQYEMI